MRRTLRTHQSKALIIGLFSFKITLSSLTASRYFISGVEALLPAHHKSFAIIGDSITDGRGSTTNANNR